MSEPAKVGRVIPAGEQQGWPVRPGPPGGPAAAPPGPPVPHGTPTPPPWRPISPPPPPPASPPHAWAWPPQPPGPAAPVELRVVVDLVLPTEEPPPPPPWYRRAWDWITYRVSPYAAVLALAASVAPIPGVGYGIGPIWGSLLYAVRITTHPATAYVIGLGAATLAGRRLVRHGGAWPLFLLSTTTVGAVYGVIRPLDIVTALTGVPTS